MLRGRTRVSMLKIHKLSDARRQALPLAHRGSGSSTFNIIPELVVAKVDSAPAGHGHCDMIGPRTLG